MPDPGAGGVRRRVPVVAVAVAAAVVLLVVVAAGIVLRNKLAGDGDSGLADGSPSHSATAATAQSATATRAGVTGTPAALTAKPVVAAGTRPLGELTLTTLVEGAGSKVTRGQTATVNYVGVSYTTGVEFDASWTRNQTFSFEVGAGSVIAGFDSAVQGATVGSRIQADIPPDLAYGNDAPAGMPSGPLRFVIDVLDAR
jgi:peptidylprolyl isomerase